MLTVSLLLLCLMCWRLFCLIEDDVCGFGLGLLFLLFVCYCFVRGDLLLRVVVVV